MVSKDAKWVMEPVFFLNVSIYKEIKINNKFDNGISRHKVNMKISLSPMDQLYTWLR
jgi:hypothetical protein